MNRRAFLGASLSAFAAPLPGQKAAPAKPPGVVVAHSPASTAIYLSSPNLLRLPDGSYFAKCDEHGSGSTEDEAAVSRAFRSTDGGASWQQVARIQHAFWTTTFLHGGDLYMIGVNSGKRDRRLWVRRSHDQGVSWTEPNTNSGYVRPDVPMLTNAGSVVVDEGRIWFGSVADLLGPPGWGTESRFVVMSAPVTADLLRASSWTFSTPIGYNSTYLNGKFGGLIEATIVVGPDGLPTVLYRTDYREGPEEKALIARASLDGKLLGLDSNKDIIDFPGACKKFIVRQDPATRLYFSLVNWVPRRDKGHNIERTRNTLALISSPDLYHWTIRTVLLHHQDRERHGFHYLDFLIEGEDMTALSRTAFDDETGGAHSQHDANYLTFHPFRNFRQLHPTDAPDGLAPEIVEWNTAFGGVAT
jgi:hypothetical protein